MTKMFFVQMATIWLVIAVVIFDLLKRNPSILEVPGHLVPYPQTSSLRATTAAELFLLAVAIALTFWVFKRQKDKIFMINARDLYITWSDHSEYWSWLPLPRKNGSEVIVEVAELKQVCWLDVSGKFDTTNLYFGTKYEVNFVVNLKDTANGWDFAPIKLKLVVPSRSEIQEHSVDFSELPRSKWINIPAGEFIMSKKNVGEISFALYEHESKMWKTGLIVKGVVICPK